MRCTQDILCSQPEHLISAAKFVPLPGRSGTSQHGPGQAPFGFLVIDAKAHFFSDSVNLAGAIFESDLHYTLQ